MANEINKLDGVSTIFPTTTKPQIPANPAQEAKSSVVLSNHLDQMVAMLAEETAPDQSTRVKQIKQQISDGNYVIDLDLLADKLTQAAQAKPNGI
jgi:flagellar biosynthesis anti-sigma factor FlgM